MNNTHNDRLQPLWSNEPSYNDLYTDYSAALDNHSLFLTKLATWKENLEGGKPIKTAPGRSKVQPKLIRKQAEWKYPALEEPFLNTQNMYEVRPRTFEDNKSAEQNQILINYQWATKVDKVKVVGDIVRTIVDEGTVIVKTGWESEEEIVLVDEEHPVYASPEESYAMLQQLVAQGQMAPEEAQAMLESGQPMQVGTEIIQVEKSMLIKNTPTYEVCNNANIIIDPTCDGKIEDAQFIIHEYETDLSTLKKQEYCCEIDIDEETGKKIKTESGVYKNLDKIKIGETDIDGEMDNLQSDSIETDEGPAFSFKDRARKKIKAYEYWGYWDINGTDETEAIVATWVGKTLIRLEKNPFPHKKLPFSLAPYMPVRGEVHGEPEGELLIENQESIGKMTRAAHDITSTQAIGQEFIDEQFFSSPLQKDNYKAGRTTYFRHGMDPRTSIHKKSVDPVPKTIFDMIQMQSADAESLSGTKAFAGGISGQALGASATGIRSAMDATSKRELSILRRLSNLFADMARKTIAMNQVYLDEQEVVRVTNSEYQTIRREDIQGEFDLIVDVSTPEKDNETAEKLNMLMQTNQANMHPEMQKILYSKIAKLWKQPDLAEEMENFEPTPDPVQQQLQQMQMENAQLENQKLKLELAKLAKDIEEGDARIAERMSRATENEYDIENKKQQARLRSAQADKLDSERDKLDMEFVDEMSGAKRARDMEDKEHTRLSKLDEKAFDVMNKQQGIQ